MIDETTGRIDQAEALFRAGLLLGAVLFLYEAMGPPWIRGIFGVAGFLLAAACVITMLFQWRVLGDWRHPLQQSFAAGLVLTLTIPAAAVLSPTLTQSLLPETVEAAFRETMGTLAKLPGMQALGTLIKALVGFVFLMVALLILAIGSVGRRRAGVNILGISLVVGCIFFYPSAETVAGFFFLFLFVYHHWEVPLILAPKIRAALSSSQREYLRELQQIGSLSTGETRIYLDNRPESFAQLADLQLVRYDNIAREVTPGPRLGHDPASDTLEKAFGAVRRCAWVAVGIVYLLMPNIPGPIDDLIVMAVTSGVGLNLFGVLFAKRGIRR
jgi:hypothetical protein